MISQDTTAITPIGRLRRLGLSLVVTALLAAVLLLGLQGGTPARAEPVAVGLVTQESAVNGSPFDWLSYQGLLRAESELGVAGTVYTSTTSGDYEPNLAQCVADGNDLCITPGFFLAAATLNAASTYTGTDFAIVDVTWEEFPPNLRGIMFAADEASYLAGTLAGLMSQSDVVGSVAGMQIPAVDVWVEPYWRAAQCANPGATTLITYTGSFGDPELGAQVAQEMIGQGADVIFGVGGAMGSGAVLTATQSGVWGIGVDVDEYLTTFGSGAVAGSDTLLTSGIKKIDNAVFSTIADVVSGTFTSGEVRYGLTEDGVGLAPYHEAEEAVPQSVRDALERVRQGLIRGTIDSEGGCPTYIYLPGVVRELSS